MANIDTVPAPPIPESKLWEEEMPPRQKCGKLYRCAVVAFTNERGEIGGTAPYEDSGYYGYGTSSDAATDAAIAIGNALVRAAVVDSEGFHPGHGWGADEDTREFLSCECTGCGREALRLRPWPTVFGCAADSAALCAHCVARETEECGCPTALECDCADVEGHLYDDRLTLAECGYPGGQS